MTRAAFLSGLLERAPTIFLTDEMESFILVFAKPKYGPSI